MGKKIHYEIRINADFKSKDPFIYRYGSTKDIELHIGCNKASIRWSMGTRKNHDDLIPCTDGLVRDAFRKVFLLHAVLFDQDLKIRKVVTVIDKDQQDHGKDYGGIPFIYSMISSAPMKLDAGWRDRKFCEALVSLTKSSGKSDQFNICVNAFLAARGRTYVVDRFSNLWTSMNAYYTWYSQISRGYLSRYYHLDNKTKALYLQNVKDPEAEKKKWGTVKNTLPKFPSTDGGCMTWLIRSIRPDCEKIPRAVFENDKNARAARMQFGDELSRLKNADLEPLHDYAVELLNGRAVQPGDPWQALAEIAQKLNTQLYFLLTFDYPYYCRCNYLHGSAPLLLLAYAEEKEIRELEAVCYFLERFLEKRIPAMIKGSENAPVSLIPEKLKDLSKGTLNTLEAHKHRMEKELLIPSLPSL